MSIEFPVVDRAALVSAYKLGRHGSVDTTVRTLKLHGVISAGVSESAQGDAGRFVGQVRLFCALNRDAVEFDRAGDRKRAQRFAAAARKIEATDAFRQLVKLISVELESQKVGEVEWPRIVHAVRALSLASTSRTLLTRIVGAISTERDRLGTDVAVTQYGRVSESSSTQVTIELSGGQKWPLPRAAAEAQGMLELGTPAALRARSLGHGELHVSLGPALELTHRRSMFDPALSRNTDEMKHFIAGLQPIALRAVQLPE
jgi:hypothetical protein